MAPQGAVPAMSRRTPPQLLRQPWALRLGAWWLVLALALAPALGRVHRVLHLPSALGVSAATVHAHGLGALFAGHGPADCQLLDQLTQGGAPAAEWPALAAAATPACPPAQSVQALLPRAALPFQARAPPVA